MKTLCIILASSLTALSIQAIAGNEVSYQREVRPILREYCVTCHVPGKKGFEASGLDLRNYRGLMKGTRHGAVIKAGDSTASTLMALIEGRADPSLKMPHGADEPLSPKKIGVLKKWIDQGAKDN